MQTDRNELALMQEKSGQGEEERMAEKDALLEHLEQLHTTAMGVERIRRNLQLDTADVVAYCKEKVLDRDCRIYRQGKNWYCEGKNECITIHASSYTIITAHRI